VTPKRSSGTEIVVRKVIAKVILLGPSGEILLLRRSVTDQRRPGEWDFPGGNAEEGELAEQATVREVFEESGVRLDPKDLRLIWAETNAYPASEFSPAASIVWLFYRAKVPQVDPRLSYEHDTFQWLKPSAALGVVVYERHLRMLEYVLKYRLLQT
jgi:8-oxo-dGTP pyrophosphatase MutT (NUDIX family)